MVEASATTNLSEVAADFVSLWNPAALRHEEIRDIFVPQSAVVEPTEVQIPVGDEIDTTLVYSEPSNEQVPGLKGLLEYLEQIEGPGGTVHKHYNITRKGFALNAGDTHYLNRQTLFRIARQQQLHEHSSYLLRKSTTVEAHHRHHVETHEHHTNQKKTIQQHRVFLDVYSPVFVQRKTYVSRVTRPIYVFVNG